MPLSRRFVLPAAVLSGTIAMAGLAAPVASARPASSLSAPTGMQVVAETGSSLSVHVRPESGARKYVLYVATQKSDLFFQNLHNGSKHRWAFTSKTATIRATGLTYTTGAFYYRVAVTDGSFAQYSQTYPVAYLRPAQPVDVKATTGSAGTYVTWHGGTALGYRIQQSTDSSFRTGVTTYTSRSPVRAFTPLGLRAGTTYYFRVSGVNGPARSKPSAAASTSPAQDASDVRIVTYNSLDASFDGQEHPGGKGAPFAQRRAGQLALLRQSKAAVIGIEEGNACVKTVPHEHCERQVDSLAAGLSTHYVLDDTTKVAGESEPDYFAGNYLLYDPSVVTPDGEGGTWLVGPSSNEREAAYQTFTVNATGATFLCVVIHTIAIRGAHYDQVRGAETRSMLHQAQRYAADTGIGSITYIGDFNSYRHEYKTTDASGDAMQAAGLLDGIAVAATLTNAQYDSVNALYRTPHTGGGAYDHIYVTPGTGVKSWAELLHLNKAGQFIGTIPSDHNPVVATLEFPS